MADQVQIPESGGGEGAQVSTQPEVNKEITEQAKEVPTDSSKETQPEPSQVTTETTSDVKPETEAIKLETALDVKPETVEVKPEVPTEVKPEEVKPESESETKGEVTTEESKQIAVEVKPESNGDAQSASTSKDQGDWQQRESELLKKIDELEKVKKERTQDSLTLELKVREEEIDLLKARVKNLETELQAALSKPSGKNHEMIQNIKQQHEELLSKARGMIFDKTKMVKNQELQIEALTSQVVSLKDINQITKDLLEIRNSEIKAMEDRLAAMEARFKAEKERYGLVLQRAQTSSNINDDLRKEYETQLQLFKQLREKYDQRVQALVAENERLKASNPAAAANGPSAGSG